MRKITTVSFENKEAKVLYDREWQEYRVILMDDGRKESTYFTDDKEDAIQTANQMVTGGLCHVD